MSRDSNITTSNSLSRFYYLCEGEFTGVLTIQASKKKWSVLFDRGKIVWAIDCSFPHRFWQRQILAHLPRFSLTDLATIAQGLDMEREIQVEISWPYLALVQLYLDGHIDSQQWRSILVDGILDVLFDLVQVGHTEKLTFRSDSWHLPHRPLLTIVFEQMIEATVQNWQEWQDSGLTFILPDYIPAIDQSTALYQQTTTAIHKNLATVIDNQRSLREIAIRQRQDLLLLTRSLVPHLKRQIISLHPPTEDLPKPMVEVPDLSVDTDPVCTNGLVAYIDDNARASEYMAEIITNIGYGFLGIDDTANALSLLTDRQPNLILMESAMPLTSGRQICQQIRRMENLARVPVVLVVDRESMTERILATLAGAASIVAHPLDQVKVSELIQRYLGNLSNPQTTG